MGSHVDSHGGLVLPMAIDLEVVVDVSSVGGSRVVLSSSSFDPPTVDVAADGSEVAVAGWGRYVAGVVWALSSLGRPAVGLSGVVRSTLPAGVGLSSSAALEVAVALALCDAAGWSVEDPLSLALACQRAENEVAGVPCGVMDQAASVLGGCVLLDCRSLSWSSVVVPDGLSVVVVDSGADRSLVSSPFASRGSEAREAAAMLGVASLREASAASVESLPAPFRERARHVVTEIGRVRATAGALEADDRPALRELFSSSYRSDLEDWEAGHPSVDAVVSALSSMPGVVGARMTGGGFGGAVVALVEAARAALVAAAFPRAWVVKPSAGAGRSG